MIVQNQIGGGGLSNAELAEATATAAQVLSGYTFYAGDKELKTGTLVPTPKVKTGSFSPIDEDQTFKVTIGFKPVAVMIRLSSFNSNALLTAFCYNNISYLVAQQSDWTGAGYWEGTSYIQLLSDGFSINNQSTMGEAYFPPFSDYSYLSRTSFYYIAIG